MKEPKPKRYFKDKSAKELTKINQVGTKISRTNSNFKPSVPLKPNSKKAHKVKSVANKTELLNKYNKIEASRRASMTTSSGIKALKRTMDKNARISANKAGAKNKVKAQGSKSMSSPTMGYTRRGKK